MRFLLLGFASCALVSLSGCGGSDFSAAHGAGSGGGGSDAGGSTSAGGQGGRVGAGGQSTGGKGTAGSGAGGAGTGGRGTGGSGGTAAGGAPGSGGTATGGGVGTGGSGGSSVNAGDCRFDHNDCGANSRCVEVTPGGYRVCTVPYPEVTSCTGMPSQDCCSSSDCQGGSVCYAAPLAPSCGGIVVFDSNVCAADLCTSDADCGSEETCVPAGTMDRKVRMCVPHSCHHDTDCTAAPGGICAPVAGGCCSGTIGLYCVYPGVGCRSNKDCPSGNCSIDTTGASRCASGPAVCPV